MKQIDPSVPCKGTPFKTIFDRELANDPYIMKVDDDHHQPISKIPLNMAIFDVFNKMIMNSNEF